ncbi:MAG: amino acid permease [Actinomycetales bacterium]|nr:amino acid permease [Actinomycetales bacterium]
MAEGRSRSSLTTRRVIFLVIAAAAPMAAMVGNIPLAVIFGNGPGVPAAFVIATVILLCFAIGYAAMSRRVVNTGAFYTYIARSLGKPSGVASAYVAVLAYGALTFGLAGAFGYYTALVLDGLGITVAWWQLALPGILLIAVLGYRSVDLSAKVLGTLMVLEFAILTAYDIAVVAQRGVEAFPAASFTPGAITSGSLGIALMFAMFSFVGFESAALYGEETRDPERSIPRATYAAVASIGAFYILTSWITIGAAGPQQVQAQASAAQGEFVFTVISQYGGEVLYDISAVLLCTSVLAGYLALHNAASRYLFALGRERVLPARLGRYHPDHLSPHVASVVVSGASFAVISAFALAGADPFTTLVPALIGVGTLGIIALQAAASLAVVAFFRRRPDRTVWQCTIAPLIGLVGLAATFAMALANYPTLTGSTSLTVNSAPYALVAVAIAGVLVALVLRRRRPVAYAAIARTRTRSRRRRSDSPEIDYRRRYCLVGAGPAGLVMARTLLAEGVPFDWFERQPEVGGIWTMDDPASPMYASAHFISSKVTSAFVGYPMPDDYPDYPSWEQVRDYIRSFARDFGLTDHVTLGVAVTSAEPLADDRWRVTLSDGQVREYDGLIAAPGVTWHPSVPELAGASEFTGEIRHSSTYCRPQELAGRRVLIVGAGNSGVDIACDAARSADAAYLSVRRGYRFLPKHVHGLPTDAVLTGAIDPPRGVSLSGDPAELVDALVGDLTRLGLPAPDHDLLQSHPIMNTQVLHYLQHGDLVAKADVERLTRTGATFVDGSSVDVDLVLLATGYQYLLPFLDASLLTWDRGRPRLYLNIYSREHDSLYVLGFVEFAGAAYQRFDEMAQVIAMDIRARETGEHRQELRRLKREDHPDLTGGMRYVDSDRHAGYVEIETYVHYLADLRDRLGWADLDAEDYSRLRSAP